MAPGSTYIWSTGETTSSITVAAVGSYSVTITNSSGCVSGVTESISLRYRASDFNQDGFTDVTDFLLFIQVFNTACNGCQEDLNNDGVINTSDYLLYVGEFGFACQ